MRISDFRFQISDLPEQISDTNLKSEIRNLKSIRRGVTIMEVLFAIMVTTIGVLAALSLLPAAGMVARKARTADASNTAVTAAVGFFDARGMRRPQSWIAYQVTNGQPRYPWAEFQANTNRSWFDGSQAYCFDPRMIAANWQDPTNPLLGVNVGSGRSGATTFPRDIVPGPNQPAMWRLSLYSGMNGPGPAFAPLPLSKLMADSVFVFDDDLNYDRAADASLVSSQVIDYLPGATTTPARRQKDGHLSWMATLVPKMDRYFGGPGGPLGVSPLINTYVLSIVVFHDRPANLVYDFDPMNERVLNVAAMPAGGITGGEVLVTAATEADLDIHANEWIMLMGMIQPVPLGTDLPTNILVRSRPQPVYKWYRVSDVEAEVTFNGATYERYITLVGQDWDVARITNTQAVAMEGVAAVMERTVKLEL
ncbi:MAG: hypothetical protein L0211_06895 [Planctomycetaceae bacterium]|nr:hypothetical protein [Planctomycetaceae bacterium]